MLCRFCISAKRQSVLNGTEIENKHFFEKINFFYKLKATGNNLCGFDLFMDVYAFFSLVCLNIIFITPVFARANMRTDAISAPPTVLTPKGIT